MSDNDNERIRNLEIRIAELCTLVKTRLKAVDRIEARVDGPDDAPERGITVRLDRCVETQRRQSRMLWLIMGAVIVEGLRFAVSVL